ncbi:MAG: hypothetical protein U0230_26670 [Polyangiales bacterium]
MAAIQMDTSAFPFVFVRFPPENANDDEVRAHIEEQRRLLGRRKKLVMLVDASKPLSSSSVQRKLYADWLKESEALSREYCVGMAVVIGSPIIRGAMQAVLWLFTPPMPVVVCSSVAEGGRVCGDWMRRAGLPNAEAPERFATASPR